MTPPRGAPFLEEKRATATKNAMRQRSPPLRSRRTSINKLATLRLSSIYLKKLPNEASKQSCNYTVLYCSEAADDNLHLQKKRVG